MKKVLILFFIGLISSFATAQSADVVTEIMEAKKLTYAHAAYLSATQLGYIEEDASYEEAIAALRKHNIIKAGRSADSPIPLKQFACILCETWDIHDSILYYRTRSPRYAMRELRALKIIPATYTGSRMITGREALAMVTRCIDYYEKQEEIKRSANGD